jgi:hypothetical protein
MIFLEYGWKFSNLSWENFKTSVNQFGRLHWNIEDLTTSTTFLDLQIDIINGQLLTKTYQKHITYICIFPQDQLIHKAVLKV